MGMRPRASSKAKAKGQSNTVTTANNVVVSRDEEAFDYPHDTPASRSGASVSVRRSENYQSAAIEIWVEVPCTPGTEIAAAEFCLEKCSTVLKDNEGDLEVLVSTLS